MLTFQTENCKKSVIASFKSYKTKTAMHKKKNLTSPKNFETLRSVKGNYEPWNYG